MSTATVTVRIQTKMLHIMTTTRFLFKSCVTVCECVCVLGEGGIRYKQCHFEGVGVDE